MRIELDGRNQAALAELARDRSRGPVAMLNLLKFKPDGGRERYLEYGAAVTPLLEAVGARVLYSGACRELLIGAEDWDHLAVVEYPSVGAFLDMVESEAYAKVRPLREEALVRSLLYATEPAPIPPPKTESV